MWRRSSTRAEALLWRGFTGLHRDWMIGPVYETDVTVAPGHDTLHLEAEEVVHPMPEPFEGEVLIDGRPLYRHCHERAGPVVLAVGLGGVRPGVRRLTVRCSSFVTLY